MPSKIDFWKLATGKTHSELKRSVPSAEDLEWVQKQSLKTRYPLLTLGVGEQRVTIKEEEREHTHIIGTTGEGKSKLLEHLIRHDIDQGRGVCFLDPSDMGDTLYNILRYCYKIGHKKVCLIDPYHRYSFGKVPVINPFHYQKTKDDASVANMMDTFRVLFKQADSADTPRIQRYLAAVLRILWKNQATIRDSIYFTEKAYVFQREQLYENLDVYDRDMMMIEGAYRTQFTMQNFLSTVNRLEPFYNSTLELIFGHPQGIDFRKMITEGWVILVNLYSGHGFEPIHTRLLGTAVINELIYALDTLIARGWKGRYHLYIDEAGEYANRNLARLLELKRKTGLRVTVAHQFFSQFEDKKVLDAINNLCKLKIAFYMPNREDRDKFVRSAYGGELADRDVSFVLSGQKKQYAVIKKPKHPAHIVRIQDVAPVEVSKEELNRYVNQIYENEWYRTPQEITKGFDRFNLQSEPQSNKRTPPKRSAPNRKTDNETSVRETPFGRADQEGVQPRHKPPGKHEKG